MALGNSSSSGAAARSRLVSSRRRCPSRYPIIHKGLCVARTFVPLTVCSYALHYIPQMDKSLRDIDLSMGGLQRALRPNIVI